MATIRVFKDLLKREPEIHNTEGETNLIDWLAQSEYSYVGQQGAIVTLNGVVIADSSRDADIAERTNIKVGLFDTVDVVARPGTVDPVTALIYVGIALAATAVAIALTPAPELPNDAGKRQSSPNNQLNAATNAFRPREAIPDIAGQVVSYPDFLQSSYYVYENNLKKFVEVFCFGVGYHDIAEVKDGETLFDGITGSTYTIYQPNETVPNLADVRSSNNVDGQALVAPDDSSVFYEGAASVTLADPETLEFGEADVATSLDVTAGQKVDLALSGTDNDGNTVNQTFTDIVVASVDDVNNSITFENPLVLNGFSGDATLEAQGLNGNYTNFLTLAGSDTTEIRFHVDAPKGLKDRNGREMTVNIQAEYQEIDANGDDIGSPAGLGFLITGNSPDAQYRTFSINVTAGRYKVRFRRDTNEEPSPGIDLVRLERLESVRYYTPAFGDVTTLITNRRATTQPTSGRQSKTNATVTRKLPIFDPQTGTFGARAATRSFAQYVMYMLNTQGNIPLENIAYQELFAIESSLSDAQLGYFDFTFDSQDLSLKQRVESCCNAARVKVYQVGNNWRFVREEAKQVRSAVFNRRNVTPESAAQTWQTFRSDDYDSVELKWVDPATNSQAYVRRRVNPSTGAIETGLGDRVREMELAGCRNELQAVNRCELEVRRIRYQRYSMADTALMDALNVGVGSRIGWADINDSDVFHGEILEQDSASSFITSEPFEPETGQTYYVYITDTDGSVSNSVVATPRADGNKFGFEATGLTAYTADGYQTQLGSMYIISQNTTVTDFILTRRGRPNERGEVQIEASIYDERMFELD